MTIEKLPLVNSCINAAVAVLLLVGFGLVRSGRRGAHQWVMLVACALSLVFLASYVTYHYHHGSTKFTGQGIVRPLYFSILISHTVLAVLNLPFVVITVVRGLKGQIALHTRIAKRTWAIWLYVSVTGPVVYLMLHEMYPVPAGEAAAPIVSSLPGAASLTEARRLHREGRDDKALSKYRQAVSEGNVSARCYAAVLADRLEDTQIAPREVDLALAADPSDVHCQVLLARLRVLEGRVDEALPVLEEAVKRTPHDAFFLATLGFAHFRKWSYLEAAAAFERSIALDDGLPANIYNAGYAYFLAGNYPRARPLLERALGAGLGQELEERARSDLDVISGALSICPMHPEVVGKKGERCSKCGMSLKPNARSLEVAGE